MITALVKLAALAVFFGGLMQFWNNEFGHGIALVLGAIVLANASQGKI